MLVSTGAGYRRPSYKAWQRRRNRPGSQPGLRQDCPHLPVADGARFTPKVRNMVCPVNSSEPAIMTALRRYQRSRPSPEDVRTGREITERENQDDPKTHIRPRHGELTQKPSGLFADRRAMRAALPHT